MGNMIALIYTINSLCIQHYLRRHNIAFEMANSIIEKPAKSITESDLDDLDFLKRQIDVPYEFKNKMLWFCSYFSKKGAGQSFRFIVMGLLNH
ncbi:MAG: hypothetical protein QXU18_09415 [Thermoplasmatales archaeon]